MYIAGTQRRVHIADCLYIVKFTFIEELLLKIFYFVREVMICYILTADQSQPVEKLSFERNFGLIPQPNELAPDYSSNFSLF